MRFVDIHTFSSLPPGTLYTNYKYPELVHLTAEAPRLGSLFIKGESDGPYSWNFTRILPDYVGCCDSNRIDLMGDLRSGDMSPELDYDEKEEATAAELDGELLVLERRDVEALMAKLSECLSAYQAQPDYGIAPGMQEKIGGAFKDYLG